MSGLWALNSGEPLSDDIPIELLLATRLSRVPYCVAQSTQERVIV